MLYESYGEIHSSKRQLRQTMDTVLARKDEIKDFFGGAAEAVFLASGSSYWMSLSAAASLTYHTAIRASAVKAGDVVLSPDECRGRYGQPVFIIPSRSGMTTEVIDALAVLQKCYPKCKVLSITEYEDNKIAKLSDCNISIPWANEVSVCQTRSFNCLYVSFICIAGILSEKDDLIRDLYAYIDAYDDFMRDAEDAARVIVDNMDSLTSVVALGYGRQYGVVIEGAYIITEMAELPSNYYQLLEYRHGPIVTANPGVLVAVCSAGDSNQSYEAAIIRESLSHGAKTVSLSRLGHQVPGNVDVKLGVEYQPEVMALFFVSLLQSFAYHISLKHGLDPDSPGQLVRYIEYR